MTEIERIDRAADYIRGVAGEADLAVVLGSGLGDYAEAMADARVIPYGDIPGFPRATVAGHAGELWAGRLHGKRALMMRGRFHSYEGHPLSDVVLPVRAMARMGVETLILTNAAGAVNVDFRPGDLMLITDFINLSGKNPLTGPNIDELGPRFPDMSRAYDKRLRAVAWEAAQEKGIPTFERAKLFGAICRRYGNGVGICGTHGKTTVTAMCVNAAMTAGLDPSAVIGGKLPKINANGRVGQSDLFICESCEFKDHFLTKIDLIDYLVELSDLLSCMS